MFCPFAVNATVERGARPRSRDGGFLTAAWRPFLGTPFSLSPLRWVVLLPPTLRSPAQCRARSRCSPDTGEADGNPARPRARVRAALCGRCRTRASAGRPRATCGLPGPRAGEDSTGDGCIVSSHLMTPLSFRRGGRPPCPQRNFPVSPAATASPGGPPPVAAWARALPAAGAHGRREEAAGQRRRHPAHPASPHQGGWEGPSALGVSYPPLPARGSHR